MEQPKSPLADIDDGELVRLAGNASQGGMLGPDGPQAELMRRLMVSIMDLDKTSSTYSKTIICLTKVLLWLTGFMSAAVIVQIVIALR